MTQITAAEIAVTILKTEESISEQETSCLLISDLDPASSNLLKSKSHFIEAIKCIVAGNTEETDVNISASSSFSVLAFLPSKRMILFRLKGKGVPPFWNAKVKFFLDAAFDEAKSNGKISWINEEVKERILSENNLKADGSSY